MLLSDFFMQEQSKHSVDLAQQAGSGGQGLQCNIPSLITLPFNGGSPVGLGGSAQGTEEGDAGAASYAPSGLLAEKGREIQSPC